MMLTSGRLRNGEYSLIGEQDIGLMATRRKKFTIEGADKMTHSQLTKRLLSTLSEETNPITHSDAYERAGASNCIVRHSWNRADGHPLQNILYPYPLAIKSPTVASNAPRPASANTSKIAPRSSPCRKARLPPPNPNSSAASAYTSTATYAARPTLR